jgi:hypothetical protein
MVTKTQRVSKSDGGVKVLVESPRGLPSHASEEDPDGYSPTPKNLATFDPSGDELKIFSQFTSVGYYTSIIRHAAPTNVAIQNLAFDKPLRTATHTRYLQSVPYNQPKR